MSFHSIIPIVIREAIRGNSTLLSLLGDRIHYQTIPQTSTFPHIYYARQSRETEDLLDGSGEGAIIDRFILEVVDTSFNATLLDTLEDVLESIAGSRSGVTIHVTDVSDLDDEYQFKSADSDALFLHGFTVQVYYTED